MLLESFFGVQPPSEKIVVSSIPSYLFGKGPSKTHLDINVLVKEHPIYRNGKGTFHSNLKYLNILLESFLSKQTNPERPGS